ncbi:MAG: O-acetylhomoserine sulfhydrylase / O-succinylhomoserine sulfhydrylase [uncultured Thermomicrobiales bacterium]|uniref:O-acetylhomoserine sulfhydrylase / O-succinylhomoserine sulfhydrylase n=1 Tax=uncultured Thermomicrobiales bacterium TaxID=1645740 RepID=A0A6J4V032_9BACT|nr:MAG: O-acetylhomoserine sulfhydrylase / O-succinylhomoserine sulfhydrylase [uncultured Thermomicrobiales bacterium]
MIVGNDEGTDDAEGHEVSPRGPGQNGQNPYVGLSNGRGGHRYSQVGSPGYAPVSHDFRTRAVHAGEDDASPVRPLTAPIYQGSVYAFENPADFDATFGAHPPCPTYSRAGLPNTFALERAVADLEGGEDAVATASGMAAISAVFLGVLAAGDHVVVSADCYSDTAALLREGLGHFGVSTSFVDTCDPAAMTATLTPQTRIVWVETISNPAMKLCDLAALATRAHRGGALLCVDNTFATPALCRPLGHGADLVIHSATKFLGGHHDLTAGVVVGSRSLIGRLRRSVYLFGPTLGAMDAWLALRGIRTLAPRMAWVSETALTVARFLDGHPGVTAVRYPGLPGGRQDDLARDLLPDGGGGMLAFDVAGGREAADRLLREVRLIPFAPSLGGVTTTAAYPPRDDDGSPAGDGSTIRLSIGLEAAADLIADLGRGLAAVSLATLPIETLA